MARCEAFYERWKKDPNWCEKSPESVRQIDHYIEMHTALVALGANPSAIYKRFPSSVALEILKIKEEEARNSVLENVAGMINRGDKVSLKDIKALIEVEVPEKNDEDCREAPRKVGGNVSQSSVKSDQPKPKPTPNGMTVRTPPKEPEFVTGPGRMTIHREEQEPEESPVASAVVKRMYGGQSTPTVKKFSVEAGSTDQAVIMQMIRYGFAEDDQEAAQSAFEEGLALIEDRIEAKIRREEALGEEAA